MRVINALTLLHLFAIGQAVLAQETSFEERLLATLPDGIELEGKPLIGPDGNEWPNVQPVVWAPDGTQVAYVGLRGETSHPVIGETVHDSYHYASAPSFGATGEDVLFRVGNRKTKKTEEWWVLVNGEKTGKEDWIGAPVFSPNGQSIAYWTQPGARIGNDGAYTDGDMVFVVASKNKSKWKVKKGKKWEDAVALWRPTYTKGGSLVATTASKKGEWFVVTNDGKKEKPHAKKGHTMISSFAISDDGKQIAIAAMDSDGNMPSFPGGGGGGMMMPGMKNLITWGKAEIGRKYDNVGMPVFSPRAKTLAYKFRRGEKMGIGFDDDEKTDGEYDFVHVPVFSPDGKEIAYAANDGGSVSRYFELSREGETAIKGGVEFLVRHNVKGKRKSARGAEYLEVRDVTFSDDGDLIAYRARKEDGWCVVVGEQESALHDEIGPPQFDEDTKKIAFGARTGRELWWRVMDIE